MRAPGSVSRCILTLLVLIAVSCSIEVDHRETAWEDGEDAAEDRPTRAAADDRSSPAVPTDQSSGGQSCGDGTCHPDGENCASCAEDCPCPAQMICLDDQCHYSGRVNECEWVCTNTTPCDEACAVWDPSREEYDYTNCGDYGTCDYPTQTCGQMGGDHCSPTLSCPAGHRSLGESTDCRRCCQKKCGDGDCAPNIEDCGNCPEDCPCPGGTSCVDHQCVDQQQTCSNMGGNHCSQSGSCPAGFKNLGSSSDCSPCCKQKCGDGMCAPSKEDCASCEADCACPAGEVCVGHRCEDEELGKDCERVCTESTPCTEPCQEWDPIGQEYDFTNCGNFGVCDYPTQTCGEMGGDHCGTEATCPRGHASLGKTLDCNPCCEKLCGNGECDQGEEDCTTCPEDCVCPANQVCLAHVCEEVGQGKECLTVCTPTQRCDEPCQEWDPQREEYVFTNCENFGVCAFPTKTCGDLGGDHCSDTASCPPGHASLGKTLDCNPCCEKLCGNGECDQGEEDCGTCPEECGCPAGQVCLANNCEETGQGKDCLSVCTPTQSCGEPCQEWDPLEEEYDFTNCGNYGVCNYDALVSGNGSLVKEQNLPETLACGATYQASVTMQNIGTSTWSGAEGYSLGARSGDDSFTTLTRIPLPPGVTIPPNTIDEEGSTHTFEFTLNGGDMAGVRLTDWQMVQGEEFFGDIAYQPVTVPPEGCSSTGTYIYHCEATAQDGYGRKLRGKRVLMQTFLYGTPDEPGLEAERHQVAYTNNRGKAFLSLELPYAIDVLKCSIDLGLEHHYTPFKQIGGIRTGGIDQPLPSGAVVEVTAIAAPASDKTLTVRGLKGGNASMDLFLPQNRRYTHVVVIPEPIDFGEQKRQTRRDLEGMWFRFDKLLTKLYEHGVAAWLVQPPATAQNIHEQAAEFAQAINTAAEYRNLNKKVVVFSYSLGAIVARLATTRWQKDAAWRDELNLPSTLPISLVAFGDGALRGANANVELQELLWEKEKADMFNADTCAAQQLLRVSCQKGPCVGDNYRAFFFDGEPITFRSGTYPGDAHPYSFDDSEMINSGTWEYTCDKGPAVFSLGFPEGVPGSERPRLVAHSHGCWDHGNTCYGDWRDWNSNGADLCPRVNGQWSPNPGDKVLYLKSGCPSGYKDVHLFSSGLDVAPGSRFPTSFERREEKADLNLLFRFLANLFCGGPEGLFHQYFAFTFIPITSALAANSPAAIPFDAHRPIHQTNCYQGSHDSPPPGVESWLRQEILAALDASPSLNSSPEARIERIDSASAELGVSLDGTASSDADGEVTDYLWQLGDGAVAVGESVTHQFPSAGSYTVALTVKDDGGATDTTMIGVTVGDQVSNTPQGIDVLVRPTDALTGTSPIAIRFPVVSHPGITHLTIDSEGPPPPEGYHHHTGLSYYRVDSDADYILFTGSAATVCLDYDEALYYDEAAIRLFSHEGQEGWIDITTDLDTDANVICGESVSIAMFGLWEPHVPLDVSISSIGLCDATCSISFTATVSNAENQTLRYSWSGCAAGATSASVVCETTGSGYVEATVLVSDSTNRRTTATHSVAVYPAEYAVGEWGPCESEDTYVCTSTANDGCRRDGQSTRQAEETAWTLDPNQATELPPLTQPCVDTTKGYIAGYAIGPWGPCSEPCGTGIKHRTVYPNAWKPTPPSAEAPQSTKSCNQNPCAYTCYDYTNMYPRKSECKADGWRVCERRYRPDGVGGTLKCWKGFK